MFLRYRGRKIVFIGPPCCGATTQTYNFAKKYGWTIICPQYLINLSKTLRSPVITIFND